MTGTFCTSCEASVPDYELGQDRLPCPNCGATGRSFRVTATAQVNLHTGHRLKIKDPSLPSKKKVRVDAYSGVEPSHKHGKLVRVNRTIDRNSGQYTEKVSDLQTGETFHDCDEPLSKHIGHGSAKSKHEP